MLYYTGASQPNGNQPNPSKSLGGYVSSSPIPNDVLNNLFSNIDYSIASKGLKYCRVIAFLNTTGQTIDQFSLYVDSDPNNVSKLKFGLARNEVDEKCGIKYFETLPNEQASPLYTTLQECEGQAHAITISNIPAGEYIGIFIQRELIPERNPEMQGQGSKTCEDFYQEHQLNPEESISNITTDHFSIVINTDDIETNLVVNAGLDRQEQLPLQSVTIIGEVTSDYPVKDIHWKLVSGPNKPTLLNENSIALTVLNLTEGDYIFQLSAKDFFDKKKSDSMQLTIIPENLKIYFGFFATRRILTEQEIISNTDFITINKGSDFEIDWSQLGGPDPVYYWFAEPLSEPVKTKWSDTEQPINNGKLGTENDLFPDPIEIGEYRYYITTYATQIVHPIEFKK